MKRNVTFVGTCWSSGGVCDRSADQSEKPHAVDAQTSLQMRRPPSFDATATAMTEIICSIIYMCTNIMHLDVCVSCYVRVHNVICDMMMLCSHAWKLDLTD